MTMHSAKGLEFPAVFMPGMEEGIFPGMQSILNPDEIEEERRLAYVGITRARQRLYLISSEHRMLFGNTHYNRVSRFVEEIPEELMEEKRREPPREAVTLSSRPAAAPRHTFSETDLAAVRQERIGQSGGGVASFAPGDRVRHKVFKDGTIVSVQPMGNDALLEIDFDSKGKKKLMANYAGLKKITS